MNIKHVAVATVIVASLSAATFTLSQSPTSSRAEDAPSVPTTQTYTAPDAAVGITRDTPTATDAPVYEPMPAHVDGNSPITATDRIPVPSPTDRPFTGAPLPVKLPTVSLPPCQTEDDASNCYWDARVMGNGQGESFIHFGGVYYYAR